MKLLIAPRAGRELSDIAAYFKDVNPSAGQKIRDSILDSLKTLEVFPFIGRRQSHSRVWKYVTRKYHYIAYYTPDIETNEVRVLSIRHPARAPRFSNR
jgi:plasmid stabilization system protein ParE